MKKVVSLRLDEDVIQKLWIVSYRLDISRSGFIRQAINRAYDNLESDEFPFN